MKRRRTEDPLTVSVNQVVRMVTDWEDACGGKFTVETKVVTGEDYVLLQLFNVDEIRVRDLMRVVTDVNHVVWCTCDFSEQFLCFRFEQNHKRKREDGSEKREETLDRELMALKKWSNEENTQDDVHTVAKFIAATKESLSILQQTKIRFDITTSPGIITLTVKNFVKIDIGLLRQLYRLEKENDSDSVIFLSPPESQNIRIRLKRSKRTVNV